MCAMLCVSHSRVVHSGTQNAFNMPVMLSFWGKEENKSAVTDLMARRGYKLNSGGSEQMAGANKGIALLLSTSPQSAAHECLFNVIVINAVVFFI